MFNNISPLNIKDYVQKELQSLHCLFVSDVKFYVNQAFELPVIASFQTICAQVHSKQTVTVSTFWLYCK